ncbi:MAG: hypothetical protein ABIP46_12955 [Polaromonas sp.]
MTRSLLLAFVLCCSFPVMAQTCEGGLYLNPQIIRGEGTTQTEISVRDLIAFLRPTGLSVSPVLNIRETQDVVTAIKRPVPPCWVYGNPVVGLSSGYKPVSVNVDPIQSAVLILSSVNPAKNAKPIDIQTLSPAERTKILARLKGTSCFGMKSGVTTALVKAEQLCGEVLEVLPQQGLGQSYLPTKAAFMWNSEKWVGLITRLSSARSANMQSQFGPDGKVHYAQLLVVPATNASWGYGLYTHPGVAADTVARTSTAFTALANPGAPLMRALDLAENFRFSTPPEATVKAMVKTLGIEP